MKKTDCRCEDRGWQAGRDGASREPAPMLFARLPDAGEIDDIMAAAREALERVPADEDIRCAKLDCVDADMVRMAALTGKAALRAVSGANGNVDPDDAFVALLMVEQQNAILAAAGATAGPGPSSCVGKCRADRKICIDGGTNKHRCNFDAFLCRINCFFTIEVGINVG